MRESPRWINIHHESVTTLAPTVLAVACRHVTICTMRALPDDGGDSMIRNYSQGNNGHRIRLFFVPGCDFAGSKELCIQNEFVVFVHNVGPLFVTSKDQRACHVNTTTLDFR